MNDRQLRYACAVWRERSFSRAAESLHVSQPSLSDQVRLLEEELGFRLFNRSTRGVDPSGPGLIFLSKAEQVLNGFAALSSLSRELRGERRSIPVRVGINSGLNGLMTADTIAALSGTGRQIRYSTITATNRRLIRLMGQDRLDAALLLGVEPDGITRKTITQPIGTSPLVLVTGRDHPLINQNGALALSELGKTPLIVNEPQAGFGRRLTSLMAENDLKPEIFADCDDIETVKSMVEAGAGVAILPDICVRADTIARRLAVRSLNFREEVNIYFVRRIEDLQPGVEKCLDRMSAHFQSQAYGIEPIVAG